MPNQYSAATVCCSDLTPRLRRRASLSMFISLKTRHLVRDSNNVFHIILIFSLVGLFYFFAKQP